MGVIGYAKSFSETNGEIELPIVIITLVLCLFTAGAAIWTLIGQNEGRIALLIILPLNILWVVLWAVSGLLNEDTTDDEMAVKSLIQQTFLSLWVIAIEWYFMTKNVVAYYKQND